MLSDSIGKKLDGYVQDYVVFDLETTGTSCRTDSVIEVSGVKVINGNITDEFSTLVDPGMPIPYGASLINGITDDMVKGSPGFEDALSDFLGFIGDLVLVGHNIERFDLQFLYRDAERFWSKTVGNDYIDTLDISRAYLPQLKHHRLLDLAQYYGVPTTGAHRALNDCRMNQQVFEMLNREIDSPSGKAGSLRKCPRCGKILVMRRGKYGEFMGCTGYPACKYTENL